ncbi:MAG: DUF4864 domain-containing protein [Rhodospirillales bacterium]|nr:DUF4864 domain-containing protein [Rhodospirillales bacterium]
MATGHFLHWIGLIPALFRRFYLLILIVVVMASPALGGPEHQLRQDIISVIRDQMAAFQRDDGVAAFSFASPDVRDQFGTPKAYLAKFQAAYKAVYRPKSVIFLNLAYSRGKLVQRVLLQDPAGRAVVALFPMMQMTDGSWKIDGCVLVPATGKRAGSAFTSDYLG